MAPVVKFERVYYYWRQSMFGHIHILCESFLQLYGTDPLFIIWDSLAYGAEGKTSAGLALLDKIKNSVSMGLEIAIAKLYVHKSAKNIDYTSISQFESEIEMLKNSASASSIVSAAKLFWLTGDNNNAYSFAQPLTTQPPANREAAALLGWIKLADSDKNCGRWFEMANADSSSGNQSIDPFVLYGKAMYFSIFGKCQEAVGLLVQLSGIAEFPEASLERARIYIASNIWDLAIEAAQEGQGKYVSDTDLIFLTIMNDLSQAGNLENGRRNVEQLVELISKTEKDNPKYITRVSKVIFALCWKDMSIVHSLLTLFSPILETNRENSVFLEAYGELLVAANRANESIDILQSAIVQDSNSISAFSNLVSAYIFLNNMGEASTQLEFLKMSVTASELPLCATTLEVKLARVNELPPRIGELLKAMRTHVDSVQQLFSMDSVKNNSEGSIPSDSFCDQIISMRLPDFAEAMKEAMEHCNTLDRTVAEPHNSEVCDLIIKMLQFIPGSVPFSYYLAVLGFGEGRYAQVTKAILFVLNSKWGFNASQCHLLLAQIKLQMKQFDEAEAALNRAVSYDFSIRSSLRYSMILAELSNARGQYEKANEIITQYMKTSEYKTASSSERLKAIISLSHVKKRMGMFDDAIKLIDNSLSQFAHPSENGQLVLCKAALLSSTDHIPDALQVLESFDVQSPHFSKARKKAAQIHLEKLKDKAAYIKCFKQLVEAAPTRNNYTLLGEALMKVKRFDEAVDCFRRASEEDPNDSASALYLARSLIVVHRFEDAIREYDRAVEISNNDHKIQLEECKILYKLGNIDNAEDLANEAIQDIDIESSDWESQYVYAQIAQLLNEIEQKREGEESSDSITDVLNLYDKLTQPSRNDIPADALNEIKANAAELNMKAAAGKSIDIAEKNIKRAAELDKSSLKYLITLAKLYADNGRVEDAKETCQTILRTDPKCEEAAIVLADIAATENISELEESFNASPSFHHTLVRLIEFCARKGLLENVPNYFTKADPEAPGVKFARGLYSYYMGDAMKALQYFHSIRNDPEWGENGQIYSFHIYANPSRKFVWCEEKPLASPKELAAAEKIMNRLESNGVDITHLEATLLLSRNVTETIQQALDIYNKSQSDDLATTLGKCRCYMRLGEQNQVTRNLNSVIHSELVMSAISSYVEAFLMMTQISIKESSFSEAENFINKAMELDKSCVKAWEIMAQIAEHKKDNTAAVEALENAWKLTSKNDCNIGYRLAIYLMRSKNPVDAIKVARVILEKHPNFPKVKEQILIPCCGMIRT